MTAINKNFVIKNGIEVGDNLIFGDKANLKVGIGTTIPGYTLDVRGGIGATSVSVGQTITANSGVFTSFISAQLNATSVKSTWSEVGLGLTFNTGIGTNLSISGIITTTALDIITDLNVSGVATNNALRTNWAQVGLGLTFTSGIGTNLNVSGVGSITQLVSTNANISGIVSVGSGITLTSSGGAIYAGILTAYKFIGDGSGLTGTISGIGIRSDGVTIGTGVTFVDFTGPGVSTVTVSAGIATIIFEGGGGGSTIIDKQTFNVGAAGTNLLTLTNAYTTGNIDVYFNGFKLSTGDFTELSSNTIGLTTAAVLGDVIESVSFRSVSISNNAIGIQSGGISIGSSFATLNFIGSGNTFFDRGNGIVDISISAGAGSTQWITNNTGIVTTSNIGIGTTNARYTLEVGYVGASGTSLWVNGNARITGILTIGTASITLDGSSNVIKVGSGITIDGNSGIISATKLSIGGQSVSSLGVGIQTVGGIVGTGATILDFRGAGISTVTVSAGIATVNITGGVSTTSFATTSFGLSGSPAILVSSAGVNTTSAPTKLYVSGNSAGNIVSLGTTTATTTLDFTQGNSFSFTLGASITIANPTGVTTGQSGVILIQENDTGGYTCSWGTSWDFASSTAPTLITTANALNALPYFARSTTSIVVGSVIAGIGTL